MKHFYKLFLFCAICFLFFINADAQTISTSYSYAWKYDTTFNTQKGSQNFAYTGGVQTFNASPGTYTLEVWGAQGGDYNNYLPSYRSSVGGYSIGTLSIASSVTLYVYVGGAGTYARSSVATGGFNGGGNARSNARYTNSGGGGTDIRINSSSLYARVIVAGGGGGGRDAGSQSNITSYSGAGGGISGLGGAYYGSSSLGTGRGGRPGTGTSAGANGQTDNSETLYAAGFGTGGYTGPSSTYGVGGGGGWYGGGAGSADADGGGGSGYVYTVSTAGNYPVGCLLNSSYYLTSANTYAGNTTFASTTGGTEVGHSGNGYARISYDYKVVDHIDSSISHIYVTTTITDFVCKNGVYNKYGFTVSGNELSSGVHTYTNHFSYGNTDSTVILNITIRPDITAYEEVEAPYSYTWPANGETYTESGIYSYSMVSQEGCDSSIILALTIYEPSGVAESAAYSDGISIAPNPTNDYIDITNETHSAIVIELYNSYGQKILSQNSADRVTRIHLHDYPSGTYFACFRAEGRIVKTKKFIKFKQ